LQPDFKFISHLKKMGGKISISDNRLIVKKTMDLKPLNENLEYTPDLFPVMAVLASQAKGVSHFQGLRNLVFKESNRIQKTSELLTLMGIKHKSDREGFEIQGGQVQETERELVFDPDKDHRMVMAAYLAKGLGCPLKVSEPEHVSKSFPNFFNNISVEL